MENSTTSATKYFYSQQSGSSDEDDPALYDVVIDISDENGEKSLKIARDIRLDEVRSCIDNHAKTNGNRKYTVNA